MYSQVRIITKDQFKKAAQWRWELIMQFLKFCFSSIQFHIIIKVMN